MQLVQLVIANIIVGTSAWTAPTVAKLSQECRTGGDQTSPDCAAVLAKAIMVHSKDCFKNSPDEAAYGSCARNFCGRQCGSSQADCQSMCMDHSLPLFAQFEQFEGHVIHVRPASTAAPLASTQQPVTSTAAPGDSSTAAPADEEQIVNGGALAQMSHSQLLNQAREAAGEEMAAMADLQEAQQRMRRLNAKIKARGEREIRSGNKAHGQAELAKASTLSGLNDQIDEHLANVAKLSSMARSGAKEAEDPVPDMSNGLPPMDGPSWGVEFLQQSSHRNVRR